MKLLQYVEGQEQRLGIALDHGVLTVAEAARALPAESDVPVTLAEVFKAPAQGRAALAKLCERALAAKLPHLFVDEESLVFAPCVPDSAKIVCVGTNYRKHAQEAGLPVPETPLLFAKLANTLAAHRATITLPASAQQVDYEAELAIVIGERTQRISEKEALSHVFGYCNANDLSARDLQFRTSQWFLGKNVDGFCPVGPYLVTADEIGDPDALTVRCEVNGEVRQHSTTADMIFSCAQIVSYVSQHMTLAPGDLILTGTPSGVVLGYPPERQVWLADGDEVTVEVEKLGRLMNLLQR
ncbi:MAG: fumarylacetoacetate hydrolase family protein [Firmicutes bacterium]|nr:fumarylacetoacetate hydrolase family protein [Bacillota bacterium]